MESKNPVNESDTGIRKIFKTGTYQIPGNVGEIGIRNEEEVRCGILKKIWKGKENPENNL